MGEIIPADVAELCAAIVDAAQTATRLEIRGGGSKSEIGAEREAVALDMRRFSGIVDYDPPELVLTVKAGTRLADIEEQVAAEHQMLAFEPWDHGPLFGRPHGTATIGGVVAAGVSGPRRVMSGGARDHLLGFKAISGRGEMFAGGGRVVKNVTGYDLPKLMAGSWGRLAALTEVTLKVLPRPRCNVTVAVASLAGPAPHRAMADAMRSPLEISAAAHLPAAANNGNAVTLFRLEGFEPSVEARSAGLLARLQEFGAPFRMNSAEAALLWDKIRNVSVLGTAQPLWRINVPPSASYDVVAQIEPIGAQWFCDWAGGLIWMSFDGPPSQLRQVVELAGGHAMLVRAPSDVRARVSAFHPRAPGVSALEERVRRAFDPAGIFETDRFLGERRAN